MNEVNGTRYFAWHWEYDECRAWHGEPDPAVSNVPLLFSFLGGETGFITDSISQATRVSGVAGDFTNADLTPVIMKILSKTR